MTDTQKTILSRVRKLLALAKDPSNEHQAAAAAAKAQELLFTHNLSMDSVSLDDTTDTDYNLERKTLSKSDKTWRMLLYHVIAKENFCTAIDLPRTADIDVVGKPHNIEIVQHLYDYLSHAINRLAYQSAREHKGQYTECGSTYRRAFRIGATRAVGKRLREQRLESEKTVAANTTCTALIVKLDADLKNAVAKHYPKLGKGRAVRTSSNSGFAHGTAAGNAIPLNRAVRGGSTPLLG